MRTASQSMHVLAGMLEKKTRREIGKAGPRRTGTGRTTTKRAINLTLGGPLFTTSNTWFARPPAPAVAGRSTPLTTPPNTSRKTDTTPPLAGGYDFGLDSNPVQDMSPAAPSPAVATATHDNRSTPAASPKRQPLFACSRSASNRKDRDVVTPKRSTAKRKKRKISCGTMPGGVLSEERLPGQPRRSRRMRIPPLEFWAGHRVIYGRSSAHKFEVIVDVIQTEEQRWVVLP